MKLKVDGQTNVTIDGQKASASQLQQGAEVRASYQGSGSEPTATSVQATSAKTTPSSGSQGSGGAPAH